MCFCSDILLSNHTECQSGSSAEQAVECFCLTGRPVATSVTLQNALCLIPFDRLLGSMYVGGKTPKLGSFLAARNWFMRHVHISSDSSALVLTHPCTNLHASGPKLDDAEFQHAFKEHWRGHIKQHSAWPFLLFYAVFTSSLFTSLTLCTDDSSEFRWVVSIILAGTVNTNECVFMFMHAEVDSSVIGLNDKYLTAGIRQFVFVKMERLFPRLSLCGVIFLHILSSLVFLVCS